MIRVGSGTAGGNHAPAGAAVSRGFTIFAGTANQALAEPVHIVSIAPLIAGALERFLAVG